MWHTSVSVWSGADENARHVSAPQLAEKEAIRTLRGVGSEREWWIWNPVKLIGHLRVGLTDLEVARIPPGLAEHDAGDPGPERLRSRP